MPERNGSDWAKWAIGIEHMEYREPSSRRQNKRTNMELPSYNWQPDKRRMAVNYAQISPSTKNRHAHESSRLRGMKGQISYFDTAKRADFRAPPSPDCRQTTEIKPEKAARWLAINCKRTSARPWQRFRVPPKGRGLFTTIR